MQSASALPHCSCYSPFCRVKHANRIILSRLALSLPMEAKSFGTDEQRKIPYTELRARIRAGMIFLFMQKPKWQEDSRSCHYHAKVLGKMNLAITIAS